VVAVEEDNQVLAVVELADILVHGVDVSVVVEVKNQGGDTSVVASLTMGGRCLYSSSGSWWCW